MRVELTREELESLRAWLAVIAFQGTRAQVRKPLATYDAIIGKIEAALAAGPEADKPMLDNEG